MSSQADRDILRALGAEVAEVAALPIQAETIAAWKHLNALQPTRPLVSIFQVPWNECRDEAELALQCADPFCRGLERELRQRLYQWRHFPGDMVVEGRLYSPVVVRSTGFGLTEKSEKRYAAAGSVPSRQFEPQIREPGDVAKIRAPEISVDEKATAEQFELRAQIFGDVLPVAKRGIPGVNFAPWDVLVRWWGVEQALLDLVARPQMIHEAMQRLTDAYLTQLDQWEALGVLALNNGNHHTGGGLCYVDELPGAEFDPDRPRAKNLWGRAMAQIFSDVSPAMHEEFALRYERRWLSRFGLAYYGCCEPLDRKLDLLRTIPNLRKISISPWADLDRSAAALGADYVVSFKPNPAHLATGQWDSEFVRRYLRTSLEKLRGCVVEVVLKDISSVGGDPSRLADWARVAREVVEELGA